ncbi:hypothetical protein PTKIN_Ptkin03bG0132300 [Pterospermum kingtungense]
MSVAYQKDIGSEGLDGMADDQTWVIDGGAAREEKEKGEKRKEDTKNKGKVAANLVHFPNVAPIKKMKAAYLLNAFFWVQSLNYRMVEFEMDAKVVVEPLEKPSIDIIEFGSILA